MGVYKLLGSIHKVQGLHGQLIVSLEEPGLVLPEFESVFIYRDGTYVPYLIADWAVKGAYGLLQLTHIATRSQAVVLRGCDVFLFKSVMAVREKVAKGYKAWEGYRVEDMEQGVLGYVTDVFERVMQPLIAVEHLGKELLIPLHEHFVKEVNAELRQIKVSLPKDYIAVCSGY